MPSDSSASRMAQSPLPSFALPFKEFITPPFIIVGSSLASENIFEIKDVVVVFPWDPVITIFFFKEMNYYEFKVKFLVENFEHLFYPTLVGSIPIAIISVGIGYYLQKIISEKIFFNIIYILLFVSGLKLIYDGLF